MFFAHDKLLIAARLALVIFLCGFVSCGGSEDPEQGGDHLPERRAYTLEELPWGSTNGRAAQGVENANPALRPIVHLQQMVEVCINSAVTTPAELARIESLLAVQNDPERKYGLLGIVDRVIGAINTLDPQRKAFKRRLEVRWQILNPAVQPPPSQQGVPHCDLLFEPLQEGRFPLNNSTSRTRKEHLYYAGQLTRAGGQTNTSAVAYVRPSAAAGGDHAGAELFPALQQHLAWYLGLRAEAKSNDPLTPGTSNGESWAQIEEALKGRPNPQSLGLLTYLALFQGLIPPEELNQAHAHFDEIRGAQPLTDPLLPVLDAQVGTLGNLTLGTPLRRTVWYQSPHLTSVISGAGTIMSCFINDSGVPFATGELRTLTDHYTQETQTPERNILLALRQSAQGSRIEEAELPLISGLDFSEDGRGCQLLVLVRNQTQFPFAGRELNGLFSREGHVATAGGQALPLPLIYLNASTLSLGSHLEGDPAAKPMLTVFRHEFAHFLGFRHSTSRASLLFPAGTNETWDLQGADQEAVSDWIRAAQEAERVKPD